MVFPFPPPIAFRNRWLLFPLALFGILTLPCAALAAHPLITDDTGTMGTGKAQLELNGEYGHDKSAGITSTATQGAAALTYGIGETTDLVVGLPYLFSREKTATDTVSENGLADTTVEVKWRFYVHDDFSLAIKPGLTLPTGDDEKGMGAGKTAYRLFLVTSKEMAPWAFHLNLGYIRNENSLDETKDIWHTSIASTVALTDALSAVANLGIESNRDPLNNADPAFFLAGLIYSVSEDVALDCGAKFGLNDAETDYTVLAGLTWKF